MLELNNNKNGILFKLRRYLELRNLNDPADQIFSELDDGFCAGYSAVWAFAKNLSLEKPLNSGEKIERDDINWFYSVVDALADWDGKSLPVPPSNQEVERLLSHIYFFQNPSQIAPFTQGNLNESMERDSFDIRLLDHQSNNVQSVLNLEEIHLISENNDEYFLGIARPAPAGDYLVYHNIRLSLTVPSERNLIKLLDDLVKEKYIQFNGDLLSTDRIKTLTHDVKTATKLNGFYGLVEEVITQNGGKASELRKPKKELSLTGTLRQAQLALLLPEIVKENSMVLLGANEHTTSIIRQGDEYCFFDSEDKNAIKNDSQTATRPAEERLNAAEAARRIFMAHFSADQNLTLSVRVFNWKNNYHSFDKQAILANDKYFIQDAENINSISGNTPIFEATRISDPESIKYWATQNKKQINKENHMGFTPLFIAAKDNKIAELAEIIALENIDVNITPPNGNTRVVSPLYIAAQNGNVDAVKMLMSHPEIDPNKTEEHQVSPLYIAVDHGNVLVVKEFLDNNSVDIHIPTDKKISPLACAILKGRAQIVEMFLDSGRVDMSKTTFNHSPFHLALKKGTPQVIDVFYKPYIQLLNLALNLLPSHSLRDSIQKLLDSQMINKLGGIPEAISLIIPYLDRLLGEYSKEDKRVRSMCQSIKNYCLELEKIAGGKSLNPTEFADLLNNLKHQEKALKNFITNVQKPYRVFTRISKGSSEGDI